MRDNGCIARFYSPELCNIPKGMSRTGGESGVEDSSDSLKDSLCDQAIALI